MSHPQNTEIMERIAEGWYAPEIAKPLYRAMTGKELPKKYLKIAGTAKARGEEI